MSDITSPPPDDSGWATLGTGDRVELASPGTGRRSGIMDWAIVFITCFIITVIWINPFGEIDTGFLSLDSAGFRWLAALFVAPLLALVVCPVYYAAFLAPRGQTLGMKINGIKVVRADNGGPPGWRPSVWRKVLVVKA